MNSPRSRSIQLWDLPTRIFHWALAALVAAAIVTGKVGGNAIDWHGRIGLAILGLLVFRIVWGIGGSTYARFVHFFPTPASVRAYLRGQWRGVGHNPLGALSVFALLTLLVVQVATGLPSNDDIAFQGPLYALLDKDLSDRLSGLHKLSIDVLFVLIALHVGAIAYYVRVRKDDLLRPMLSGTKRVAADAEVAPARRGSRAVLFAALLLAAAAVYAASGHWLDAAPATAAAPTGAPDTPSW